MKLTYKEYKETKKRLYGHLDSSYFRYGKIHGGAAINTKRIFLELQKAGKLGLEVVWDAETDPWLDFVDDYLDTEETWVKRFESGSWEVLTAVVEFNGEVLTSLGGIVLKVGSDIDRDSYEVELLCEAVGDFEDTYTELTESDLETRYDEFLESVYGDCNIAGYQYSTADALKEVDPIAYREGFNNWIDSEVKDGNLIEHDNTYYED